MNSREKFLRQLDLCVKHQRADIVLPDPPRCADEWLQNVGEILPPEPMGNGGSVDTQHSAVWGLRAPNEEPLNEWWR